MSRKGLITGLAAVAAMLGASPAADAAVTFGSKVMGVGPAYGSQSAPGVTRVLRNVGPADLALGGATAPTDGVITHWRFGVVEGDGGIRLRVLRGNTSVFQGPIETLTYDGGYAVREFDVRAPVRQGDAIGIDQLSGIYFYGTLDGASDAWAPPLGAKETRPPSSSNNLGLIMNADLEPDVDSDGFGDESQDPCPGQAGPGGCPAPVPPDTVPPETTITKGAPNKLERSKVKLSFVSSEGGSTFECRLDAKNFKPCTSPRKLKRLDDGKHKFRVRAVDPAGNVDPTPAKDKFKVL